MSNCEADKNVKYVVGYCQHHRLFLLLTDVKIESDSISITLIEFPIFTLKRFSIRTLTMMALNEELSLAATDCDDVEPLFVLEASLDEAIVREDDKTPPPLTHPPLSRTVLFITSRQNINPTVTVLSDSL